MKSEEIKTIKVAIPDVVSVVTQDSAALRDGWLLKFVFFAGNDDRPPRVRRSLSIETDSKPPKIVFGSFSITQRPIYLEKSSVKGV